MESSGASAGFTAWPGYDLRSSFKKDDDGLAPPQKLRIDRSAAEALKGEAIAVARGALPDLDDDEGYYVTDLVGLSAEQSDGRSLGTVHDVFTLAGRLIARLDDGLVPLDGPVIAHVDFEAGVVTFDLPEGLFEAQR